MRMLPASLHEDVLKEFNKFDEQPDALRRWIRDRVQWLKWSDASNRKHHLLEGDDGDKGSDDAESIFSAELAGLVKSGAANDEEVCAFVRRRFPGKKPEGGKKPERERPARSKADTTCPNCFEKGHTGQECKKPKIDVKDRACFNCGKPGHPADRCPEGRPKLKALTRDSLPPAANGRAQTPKYTLCLESYGFVPAHRITKRPTPWSQAVGKATPKGTIVNEVIECAFAQYARLEASRDDDEEGQAEAAEHPPVSTAVAVRHAKRRAPQATRRRLCTLAEPLCCPGNKAGCCGTTTQSTTTQPRI